ncbi:MAG: patatin-like phospholipase family protein [Cytophagaceae bacterium]
MKGKSFLSFTFIILSFSLYAQSTTKVGLTLSGGGARGLAHIGLLKAIDSSGLKIDYITGTSMGSIIGSLYAIGYSADSIEKIARKLNWEVLLSNNADLRK